MNVLLDIPAAEASSVRDAILRQDAQLEVRQWSAEVPPGWADCLLTWAPAAAQLRCLSPRGFVQAYGAGVDRILGRPELAPAIPVARIVDKRMTLGMVQHIVLAILRWVRAADIYREQQTRRVWVRQPHPDAADFPVGVLGMGAMGAAVGEALGLIGFPVQGWRRNRGSAGDFSAFLRGSRILVCLAPLTPETRGLVDATALAQLPAGSYVVNCSRGAILVERDLLAAIESGHVVGAALDVFEDEPLPAESPLWVQPNIVVTPHIATFPTAAVAALQVAENLRRHKRAEPLENLVDRTHGY